MAIINITFEMPDTSVAAMLMGLVDTPKITLSTGRVQAMKKAGVWNSKTKRNKIIASYAKADAPYGYKKDGTPAKKRGRRKVAV